MPSHALHNWILTKDARNEGESNAEKMKKKRNTHNLLPKSHCLTNFSANNFQTFFSRVAWNVHFGFFLFCFLLFVFKSLKKFNRIENDHKLNISNIFLRMIMLINELNFFSVPNWLPATMEVNRSFKKNRFIWSWREKKKSLFGD